MEGGLVGISCARTDGLGWDITQALEERRSGRRPHGGHPLQLAQADPRPPPPATGEITGLPLVRLQSERNSCESRSSGESMRAWGAQVARGARPYGAGTRVSPWGGADSSRAERGGADSTSPARPTSHEPTGPARCFLEMDIEQGFVCSDTQLINSCAAYSALADLDRGGLGADTNPASRLLDPGANLDGSLRSDRASAGVVQFQLGIIQAEIRSGWSYSTSLCSSEKLSCTLVSQTQSVPIGVRGAFEFPGTGAKSGTPDSVLRGQLTKIEDPLAR